MTSGKWVWMSNYFDLVVTASIFRRTTKEYLQAKVTFQEAIDFQFQSTQGSPEAKGAGGSYYTERQRPIRRAPSNTNYEQEETPDTEHRHNSPAKKKLDYKSIQSSLTSVIMGQTILFRK